MGVVAGFAGSAADGITLYENLKQNFRSMEIIFSAAVELARRMERDNSFKKTGALLIVGDKSRLLVLSGNGDVIEPDDNIIAIGSEVPMQWLQQSTLQTQI